MVFSRDFTQYWLQFALENLAGFDSPRLNLLNSGEHEVNMLNSLEGGKVRIGMSETAAHYFTRPAVFEKFCTRYPKVHLEIMHLPIPETQNAILTGDIDFAILGLSEDEITEDFEIHRIYSSGNIPVVGEKYATLAHKTLSLEQLAALPLIFVESGYSIRKHYEALYRQHGLDFTPNIETPTLDIQLKAVKLGLGYSFVPHLHVKDALADGSLYRLDLADVIVAERCVCLLTAKGRPMSRAAQALVDILLSAVDEYCNW